jgi:hypothetical protein
MLKHVATLGLAAVVLGATAPAWAQGAQTYSPDEETITGGREVYLPSVPLTPYYYALPMQISVVQDSSITTNTPITNQMALDVPRWEEAVRGCLYQKPRMVRRTVSGDVPFIVGGNQGTIVLNSNGRPVCPM